MFCTFIFAVAIITGLRYRAPVMSQWQWRQCIVAHG